MREGREMNNATKKQLMPRQTLGLSGAVLGILALAFALGAQGPGNPPQEALTGLDNQTNGAIDQFAYDQALDTFS
jgi:hypothetical protein